MPITRGRTSPRTPAGRGIRTPASRGSTGRTPTGAPAGSMRRTIAQQQLALQWMSDQLAGLQTPSAAKTCASPIPEKCSLEYSKASFRSWERSMISWSQLSRWTDREAVLNIRLHCDAELQRTIDLHYDQDTWEAFTTSEALKLSVNCLKKAATKQWYGPNFFSWFNGMARTWRST